MQVRRERQQLLVPVFLQRSLLVVVLLVYSVLTGCHSSPKTSAPTVAFSKLPAAQESHYEIDIIENRDYKRDIVEGRATGARPRQRIVLYAKTDGRWGLCHQS